MSMKHLVMSSTRLCLLSLCLLVLLVVMISGDESTALITAAQREAWDEVRKILLHSTSVNIDAKNEFGSTALIYAAKAGNVDICRELLDMGANVNAEDAFSHTPLLEASRGGHYEMVKVLLDGGADVDARDFGETALMWASEAGYDDIVKLLIERGADVNARSNIDDTALISAVTHGRYEITKILLENGADVNAEDGHGYSAYVWASFNTNYTRIQELLLEKGAKKDSPLIVACRMCRVSMIKYLLETQIVDVNVQQDGDGNTALTEAIINCEDGYEHNNNMFISFLSRVMGYRQVSQLENVITLFVQDGRADVSLKNKRGESALQLAMRLMKRHEVISLLHDKRIGTVRRKTTLKQEEEVMLEQDFL